MNLVNFECEEVMKYNCKTPKELLKKIKNEENNNAIQIIIETFFNNKFENNIS